MLIGYVSDERYVAIPGVALEFARDGSSWIVQSTPRGAVYADLPPGEYRVTLAREGYGPKSVRVTLPVGEPYQFRLLADRLLGYVWPKWARSGERGEFRVHSRSEERRVGKECRS